MRRTVISFAALFLAFLYLKGAEAEARAEFDEFFTKNNQIMMVIEPKSGQILDANPAAVEFYRFENEDLETLKIQDINQLSPEQVARERELAAKQERNFFIFRHKLGDGVIKTVEVSSFPIAYKGGAALVSVIRDVTAEREIQDSLWHYQNRLEELVEIKTTRLKEQNSFIIFMSILVLLIISVLSFLLYRSLQQERKINQDLDEQKKGLDEIIWGTGAGTWEWWVQSGQTKFNDKWAELIGYSLEELEPLTVETWSKLLHKDDLAKAEIALQKCFNREIESYSIEFRMKHKEGNWVWIHARGKVAQWGENDTPIRMVGTHLDVTSRKAIEKRLEKARSSAISANKAKSVFLANMSHELRTPMMGIRGVHELLRQKEGFDKETQQLLDDLDFSSQSLHTLLNDVLDLSKIEAGKFSLNYVVDEPAKIIKNICNLFKPRAEFKGLSVNHNAETMDGYFCELEDTRFRQILNNLIGNAVKFTDEGSITVEMVLKQSSPKDILTIYVKDTGGGLTKEEQKRIFKRFEQADNSPSRKFEGSGLGLTICRELSILMGGEVGVESEIGKGSIFHLKLPVERAKKFEVVADPFVLKDLKILLAEDNPINQKVIQAMLVKKGHEVELASNGLEAYHKALKEKFDLILMDMNMPVMDGMEATKKIRASGDGNSKAPIIAFTADAIKEHREKFIKSGVNDVVTKPISIDALQFKISEVLSQ